MKRVLAWLIPSLALVHITGAAAWCDTLNFYNSPPLEAKITTTAGDIIRYRTGIGRDISIHRMNLTNRLDTVTTRGKKVYTGEVIYMDGSILQMKTPYGNTRIARLLVKNIILGMPKMDSDNGSNPNNWMETTGQLQSDATELTPPELSGMSPKNEGSPSTLDSEMTGDKPTVDLNP